MRTLLTILLLVHGFIHFMGFAKAFQIVEIREISQPVSKTTGLLWLLCGCLFVLTIVLLLLKSSWWSITVLAAILISQVLIILHWQEAKFGTFINAIILVASLATLTSSQFQKTISSETLSIIENAQPNEGQLIQKDMVDKLPEIVQKWLRFSGVEGEAPPYLVRLKQRGVMKTVPNGPWLPFTASQYVDPLRHQFVWATKVKAFPGVYLFGRDKLVQGQAEMLIKLVGAIPVVNEKKNIKINSGALIRFLSEICWYPAAALDKSITWETKDPLSALAKISLDKLSAEGVFNFSPEGRLLSFEAMRYYGGYKEAPLEKWLVKIDAFENFNGYMLPKKCHVYWKLKEGDFEWLQLEITDIEYNKKALYPSLF